MARKPGSTPTAMRNRAAKTAAAIAPASPLATAPAAPKKRVSLAQFAREVRAEARKITWTTRKETWITSVMVAIMVVMAALFLSLVDWIFGSGMALILKLVNGG
jgi:preprotein translocase subunit SecE